MVGESQVTTLANLSKGRLSEDKENLLGSLFATQFQVSARKPANESVGYFIVEGGGFPWVRLKLSVILYGNRWPSNGISVPFWHLYFFRLCIVRAVHEH